MAKRSKSKRKRPVERICDRVVARWGGPRPTHKKPGCLESWELTAGEVLDLIQHVYAAGRRDGREWGRRVYVRPVGAW